MAGGVEVLRHEPGAQPSRPVFFYDLGSPECYLAAEQLKGGLPVVPEWQPVELDGLPGAGALGAFRCQTDRDIYQESVELRAAGLGLQPLRWPPDWPTETRAAMLAATYARSIGRAVAFSLAAFRQAFAGGRDLHETDTILIAASANEMHPRAVLKGIEMRATARELDRATAEAAAAGVRELPTLRVGDALFAGADSVPAATAAMCELAAK